MNKTIQIVVLALLWPFMNSSAQNIPADQEHLITISGRVINEKGEGLAGASLRVKGSRISILTDAGGLFRLTKVPLVSVLSVSFIGYLPQDITIDNARQQFLINMLPDYRQLEEVIVSTGYQEIPMERATGSFATVNKELFNRQVSTDVISRLKAVAPSLLFDERSGTSKLSIRGRSTIFANDQPLIVVDNFPYDGDINNINPNDIENITLLRDAAAASIWGARAGNGVIVITTRKGHMNQPLTVEANTNITLNNGPDLFYQPRASSSDFIDTEQLLFDRGFYNADLANTTSRPPVSPVVELLALQRSGQLSAADATTQINILRQYDVRNDMKKYLYQTGLNSQNSLNLKGGSAEYNYYFSAGYDDNLSNVKGNGYKRLTMDTRQNFKPFKNLEINAALNYTQSRVQRDNILQDIITGGPAGKVAYPYTRLADEQGNPLAMIKDYPNSFKDAALAQGFLDWNFVPLNELNYSDNKTSMSDTRLQTGLRYEAGRFLTAEIKYQFEQQLSNGRDVRSQDSYFTRNLVNRYTTLAGSVLTRNIPAGAFLNRSDGELNSHNGRGQLNYNRQWPDHQLAAITGIEIREVKSTGNRSRFYGFDPNLGSSLPVNYMSTYSLYPSGSALIPSDQSISGTTDRFRSYYANAAYTYKDRYIFSASGRIDQSNYFGLKPNQRAVPLWSAGVKWDVSSQGFYKLSWLPDLKIKATYGFNGNIDKTVTAFTTANFSNNTITGTAAANINNPPNPNLGWERTGILNLGIEFSSLNHIITGNIEYYRKRGRDLVGDSPLDPTSGQTTFRGNVAHMKGSGVDLELNSLNINKKFRWESGLLFSYTTDEITRYDVKPAFASYMADASLTGSLSSYSPTPGKPLFGVYSRRWAGLDPATGNPMGYVNGQPSMNYSALNSSSGQTVDSLVFHGRALPPVYGAIRNTISYKGFSVSGNITYRFGYFFRGSSLDYSNFFNKGISHSDYTLRWQKPGDEAFTHVPSLPAVSNSARDNFYRNSEVLVEKGDHIRLQDISFSYSLSKKQFGRLPVQNALFYIYLNNASLLWRANDKGIDPDFPSMPLPLNISFGIKSTL